MMSFVSFWKEFNERAGFVWVIAVTNPIFVTIYVMFFHGAHGGLQFFTIGMLMTAVVCLISGSFMSMVIFADRRTRRKELKRAAMWHDAMPYDPRAAARQKVEAH